MACTAGAARGGQAEPSGRVCQRPLIAYAVLGKLYILNTFLAPLETQFYLHELYLANPLLLILTTQHRLRDRRSLTYTAGRLRLAAAGGPGRACQRPHVYDLRLYGRAAQNLPGWSGSRGWLAAGQSCRKSIFQLFARDLYPCLTQRNYTGK